MKYNFWYVKDGKAEWASSRDDKNGLMITWIRDLEKKYIVRREGDNYFLKAK